MVSEEKANQEVTSQQQENTPSPGAMLKARRETLGLSQQDIADKLFLKSFQINDLESDVIDEKSLRPSPVFLTIFSFYQLHRLLIDRTQHQYHRRGSCEQPW